MNHDAGVLRHGQRFRMAAAGACQGGLELHQQFLGSSFSRKREKEEGAGSRQHRRRMFDAVLDLRQQRGAERAVDRAMIA